MKLDQTENRLANSTKTDWKNDYQESKNDKDNS